MSIDTKTAFWQKHFTDWQQSGLSQKGCCAQHDLKIATFGYWRRRLAMPMSKKLIPVTVHRPADTAITLTTGGIHMEVPLSVLEPVLLLMRRLQAAA
jgi:hypothetical protein